MTLTVEEIVTRLGLVVHPEGGFYNETYRSGKKYDAADGERSVSTAIYFLLTAGNFSAFHRIKSDEGWHHYLGDPVHVHAIDENGFYQLHHLGSDLSKGESPQAFISAGQWFGSESVGGSGYSLVGCTVAPGFDFADFELAEKESLLTKFPHHSEIITRLTR